MQDSCIQFANTGNGQVYSMFTRCRANDSAASTATTQIEVKDDNNNITNLDEFKDEFKDNEETEDALHYINESLYSVDVH